MLLEDWLKKKKIRPYTFANKIGISTPNIYRILNGKVRMGANMALKIEAATNCEVSRIEAMFPEDFVDIDHMGRRQMRAFPKIHFEMIDPETLGDKDVIEDEEFRMWAYGSPREQTLMSHWHLWSKVHPELSRIEDMTIDDGLAYMKSEYKKYLESKEKSKKKSKKSK